MSDAIVSKASTILDAARQLATKHAVSESAALKAIELATPKTTESKPAAAKKEEKPAA